MTRPGFRQSLLFLSLLLLAVAGSAGVALAERTALAAAGGRPLQGDPPRVVLSLLPASQAVEPGQTVDVELSINAAIPVRSMQASLKFDPTVLQATKFEAGPYFKAWAEAHGGTALVFPDPAPINN